MRMRVASDRVIRAAIVGAAAVAAVSVAAAQTPGEDTPAALARVYSCAQVSEAQERLACYDGAVGRLKQAETGGEFVAVDRQRAEAVERDSFGFNLPSLARIIPGFGRRANPAEAASVSAPAPETSPMSAPAPAARTEGLNELQAAIGRLVQRPSGLYAFELINGQVWVQTEPRRVGNVRPGTQVTIRRAAFGSFMLVSERGGAGHRVRREQ